MIQTFPAIVHVVLFEWPSSGGHDPTLMVTTDERSAYVRAAEHLHTCGDEKSLDDMAEYSAFLADYPYDPNTATPEEAKTWVDAYSTKVWSPLITIDGIKVTGTGSGPR